MSLRMTATLGVWSAHLCRQAQLTALQQRSLFTPPTLLWSRQSSSLNSSIDPFPTYHDVPSLRSVRRRLFTDPSRTVGFVPTMGALHEGHLSLVRHALRENTDVFISIYLNPTQFGVNEDLDKYPKTWEADMAKLLEVKKEFREQSEEGTAGEILGVFAPTTKVMYPVYHRAVRSMVMGVS